MEVVMGWCCWWLGGDGGGGCVGGAGGDVVVLVVAASVGGEREVARTLGHCSQKSSSLRSPTVVCTVTDILGICKYRHELNFTDLESFGQQFASLWPSPQNARHLGKET